MGTVPVCLPSPGEEGGCSRTASSQSTAAETGAPWSQASVETLSAGVDVPVGESRDATSVEAPLGAAAAAASLSFSASGRVGVGESGTAGGGTADPAAAASALPRGGEDEGAASDVSVALSVRGALGVLTPR